MVAVLNSPTFKGTVHLPPFNKVPTLIRAFPDAGRAPMAPYEQIRSRTSGFMLSSLSRSMQGLNIPELQEGCLRLNWLTGDDKSDHLDRFSTIFTVCQKPSCQRHV